jgi:hypothetical protein
MTGCSGEKGAKVTGVLMENGAPLKSTDKDRVNLSLIPTQKDEKSLKANPGADFKAEDATFVFVGPAEGLVPEGTYKISVVVRTRHGSDRLNEQFIPENTPLTYTVNSDRKQEIVIDVSKKTVMRK